MFFKSCKPLLELSCLPLKQIKKKKIHLSCLHFMYIYALSATYVDLNVRTLMKLHMYCITRVHLHGKSWNPADCSLVSS